MKKCVACGLKNNDDAIRCFGCGHAFRPFLPSDDMLTDTDIHSISSGNIKNNKRMK